MESARDQTCKGTGHVFSWGSERGDLPSRLNLALLLICLPACHSLSLSSLSLSVALSVCPPACIRPKFVRLRLSLSCTILAYP